MMWERMIILGMAGYVAAQGGPSITRVGTEIAVDATDLKLRIQGQIRGSMSTLVDNVQSLTTLTASISQATATATENGNANNAILGQLSAQFSTLLPFSGPAVSQASVTATTSMLQSAISTLESRLTALEQHSLDQCNTLCVHGTCAASTSGTSTYTCTCTGGAYGDFCDQTYAPTASPTAAPTAAPTLPPIASCAEATITGTYPTTTGLGEVYCVVESTGQKWMRISYWPGSQYTMTTDAVSASACAVPVPSTFCKLSDTQINSVIPTGSSRVYWGNTTALPQSMYLRTDSVYVDTAPSFGINLTSASAMVATSFPGTALSSWTGPSFTQRWIDFLYVNPRNQGQAEACTRFFIGHGRTDCWSGPVGDRCIRGGSTCTIGRYSMVPGWSMYMAAV